MCHQCQSCQNRSGLVRTFKVLPQWNVVFCYFSRQNMAIYLSSAAFLPSEYLHGLLIKASMSLDELVKKKRFKLSFFLV